jgi:hypothetical protein
MALYFQRVVQWHLPVSLPWISLPLWRVRLLAKQKLSRLAASCSARRTNNPSVRCRGVLYGRRARHLPVLVGRARGKQRFLQGGRGYSLYFCWCSQFTEFAALKSCSKISSTLPNTWLLSLYYGQWAQKWEAWLLGWQRHSQKRKRNSFPAECCGVALLALASCGGQCAPRACPAGQHAPSPARRRGHNARYANASSRYPSAATASQRARKAGWPPL